MQKERKKKSKTEIRLKKIRDRVKKIEKETELKKQLKEAKQKLKKIKNVKRRYIPIKPIENEIDIKKLVSPRVVIPEEELGGVRKAISDSEKMWVVSMWENRKKLDPNFDPDTWFKSSVYMGNKIRDKKVDDFWTGQSQYSTDDFWTGPTMWNRKL